MYPLSKYPKYPPLEKCVPYPDTSKLLYVLLLVFIGIKTKVPI